MKKFWKYCAKLMFYHFTDTQAKDNISAKQYQLQYNVGIAMQDNAAQCWYSETSLKRISQAANMPWIADKTRPVKPYLEVSLYKDSYH